MALHRQLIAFAVADPAREICGLLLGHDGAVDAIVEATNVAANPARTFEIDPRVQIDAVRAARAGGLPVMGCYHSHPGGVARPSAHDLDMARLGSVWLIVAGADVTAWKRTETGFDPLRLIQFG